MTAEPVAVDFDPRSGLIVVDVQNDFADPAGNLYVPGGDALLPLVNDLIAAARRAGATVAYTQDWHPASTPHFTTDGGVWPVHCVAETWGAALHPDLDADGPVIRKGTGGEDGYSGFHARDLARGVDEPTGLARLLDEHGTRTVVVVGLARDVCVKETACDAARLGYDTTVLLAATRAVELEPGADAAAREAMTAAGVTVR